MPDPLKFYHRLPYPLKTITASLRGYYLTMWRYGTETEAEIEQALSRERWSSEQWKVWKEERLAYILNRAVSKVPYYRDLWSERRRKGNRESWDVLGNWPILEKEAIRKNPRAFIADDCDPNKMFHEHTSGTSGKPIDLWWSRNTTRKWYALFETRCLRWHGLDRKDRWAILGGQLVTPVSRKQPPFWVWNAAMNQLYMSSYHLSKESAKYYLAEMDKRRINYLLGYASSLYALAQEAIREGIRPSNIEVALTNAEPLYKYQREVIEEAFGCPVRETYGMAEIVAAASECEKGSMHLWPEVGIVEISNDGLDFEQGNATGEIIATGLINEDMPLIRYAVGDRAVINERIGCKCGRCLPLIQDIEGRTDDVIYTRDGRRIGRLDPVFKSRLPFVEVQIIQETFDVIRLLYVPDTGFTNETEKIIVQRLRDRLGPIQVIFESVLSIPRGPNGKFRAVISKLPPETTSVLSK